jgi:branched-chain amino acid transport system substrate-binding protein
MMRRVCSTLGWLVFAAVSTGCGNKPVVGVLLPSTGAASTYGESIESGVRLAISDARERGQLPPGLEVVWGDTGSDPDRAVAELHRMMKERRVKLIIGGATTPEATALMPEIDAAELVCLSPSASAPGLAQQSKYFFRIFPSDDLEGRAAGKFVFDRLKNPTIVIYSGNSEYAKGIEPTFREEYGGHLGGTIVGEINIDEEGWQQKSAQALRSERPEGVYIVGYADEILGVLSHLRERRYEGLVVTTSAFDSKDVIHKAGQLAEGVLFPLPPFDRTSEQEPVLSFVHRYMDAYNRAPDVFAAHGYDAMNITLLVLSEAKAPQTQEIKKTLHFGLTDYMGVTGPILFDDYGDVKHYPTMFIVKDGQVLSYQRYLKAERARIVRNVQDLLLSGK